jgi:starch synthase
MPKKILFINQEITPYVPESPMALLGQQLPETIQGKGFEIRTFMPKWGTINERRGQLHEVIRLSGMNITINENDHPLLIKVASIPVSRVQVYFIDNEDYFTKRKMESDDSGQEYADNGERAIFYARGVLETVKKLRWKPDVVICQGWMGAVVPLYLKTVYNDEPCFAGTKVITSIFSEHLKNDLGGNFKRCVEFKEVTEDTLKNYKEKFDFLELGKLAIDFSDGIAIAAPNANTDLHNYALTKDVPVLEYPGEDFGEAYSNFFKEIIKG